MNEISVRRIIGSGQKAELMVLQALCFDGETQVDCDPGGFYLAAYDGKRMVGFAMAIVSPIFEDTIYLIRVGVDPDYRGKGLQKDMMARIERWAKQKGFVQSVSDTANFSIASMRAFISLGYKPFWPPWAWSLSYSMYWRKQL